MSLSTCLSSSCLRPMFSPCLFWGFHLYVLAVSFLGSLLYVSTIFVLRSLSYCFDSVSLGVSELLMSSPCLFCGLCLFCVSSGVITFMSPHWNYLDVFISMFNSVCPAFFVGKLSWLDRADVFIGITPQ